MSRLNGRVDRLERKLGRPMKKPAGVLLYDRATVRSGENGDPVGPFTLGGSGERIEHIDEARGRFSVLVVLPRNGREAPPEGS